RAPLAPPPRAAFHRRPVGRRVLLTRRHRRSVVLLLEAAARRGTKPRARESSLVRPAPPRRHPTRWVSVEPGGRRARVAPPGTAPLRLPARPRVARPRRRRDRRPGGGGGGLMIMPPATVRAFLCTRPTDMRKGFDGLAGLVQGCFGQDLLSGHLF